MTCPPSPSTLESDCPECSGAGFFGNGPIGNSCSRCHGFGVLRDGRPYDLPLPAPIERKPMGRAENAVWDKVFRDIQERKSRRGFGS